MQVTVESTGTLERKMRVELPVERVYEKEVDSRLKKVGRTAKIKGFRPGKIPPQRSCKQRYGKQIRQEVLSDLMQKSYTDAVVQENLQPAGGRRRSRPRTTTARVSPTSRRFEIMPEVELSSLDKIKVEKPEVDIGDADLDEDDRKAAPARKRRGMRSIASQQRKAIG